MRLILNLLAVILVLGAFQSCVSNKKYNELLASKEATDRALAETQSMVQNLQKEKNELEATLESDRNRLNEQISGLQNEMTSTKNQIAQVQEKLNMTEAELNKIKAQISGAFSAYKDSGLSLQERDGRLYVMTSGPVQYRTGSAALSRAERKALDELAGVLKSNPNLKILVEGHTDNVKFKPDSGSDNWQLSQQRALSVVRQLVRSGVKPEQVAAVGRGEYMPAAPNDSADGRSKNRRTVVLPDVNLSELLDEGNN
jgi:chemotaxis protein MotB